MTTRDLHEPSRHEKLVAGTIFAVLLAYGFAFGWVSGYIYAAMGMQ